MRIYLAKDVTFISTPEIIDYNLYNNTNEKIYGVNEVVSVDSHEVRALAELEKKLLSEVSTSSSVKQPPGGGNVANKWRLSISIGFHSTNRNRPCCKGFLSVVDYNTKAVGTGILKILNTVYKENVKLIMTVEKIQLRNRQGYGDEISTMSFSDESIVYYPFLKQFGIEKYGLDVEGNWNEFVNNSYGYQWEANVSIIAVVPDDYTEVDSSVRDKLCIIKKLLLDSVCTDTTLIAKNGVGVKCHKSFLAVHSLVLATMFQTSMTESQTNTVEMPDMSEAGIRAFLAYLYCWETKDAAESSIICFEIFAAGHKYDINSLEICMEKIMLQKNNDWFDVDVAMKLFLFARNLSNGTQLVTKAVQVLKAKFADLKKSPSYRKLFQDDPTAAMDLCKYAFSS